MMINDGWQRCLCREVGIQGRMDRQHGYRQKGTKVNVKLKERGYFDG